MLQRLVKTEKLDIKTEFKEADEKKERQIEGKQLRKELQSSTVKPIV